MERQSGVLIPDRRSPLAQWAPRVRWSLIGRDRMLPLAMAGLCGLIALVLTSPPWAVAAKSLADPIAHSTSAGAALALLIGALLSLMAIAGARRWPVSERVEQAAAIGLLAATGIGNAANLLAHWQSMHALGLPVNVPVYHWAGELNTFSFVAHSHAGKSALAAVFGEAGAHIASAMDVGSGLARVVPGWTAWVCGICLLVSASSALVLMPRAARARQSPWLALLYFVCAFNAIKSIADGGPLAYRFGPMFIGLVLLTLSLVGARLWVRRAAFGVCAVCAVAILVGWGHTGALEHREAQLGLATTLALLILLTLLACHDRAAPTASRWSKSALFGVRTVAALTFATAWLAASAETLLALWLPLAPGTMATTCSLSTLECHTRNVAVETADAVYRNTGDDPLKPRVTFLHRADEVDMNRLTVVIQPVRTGPSTIAGAYPVLRVRPIQALEHGAGALLEVDSHALPRLFGTMPTPYSSRNYHVFLHLLAAHLRSQGLTEFAMLPLRGARDAQAFGLTPR